MKRQLMVRDIDIVVVVVAVEGGNLPFEAIHVLTYIHECDAGLWYRPVVSHSFLPPITTMASPSLTVFCSLINSERKFEEQLSEPFSVDTLPNHFVDHLKQEVVKKNPNDLRGIDSRMLTVWRCIEPKLLASGHRFAKSLSSVERDTRSLRNELSQYSHSRPGPLLSNVRRPRIIGSVF